MAIDYIGRIDNQSSSSKDAILTTNYEDDYIVRGNGFKANDVLTLAGGGLLYFTLDPTTVPKDEGVFILPITIQSSAEEVRLTVYEDTNYTGGVEAEYKNSNRNYPDTYDFIVLQGASGTTKGTFLQKHAAFAASQGNSQSSGSGGSAVPLILNTSKKYLFELENLGGGSTNVEYDTLIFQIPFS